MNNCKGSAGGKIMAIVQRQNAVKKYYDRPNTCLNCQKVIEVVDGVTVGDTKKKKFCNQSCAAIYNNKKRGFEPNACKPTGKCMICKCDIRFVRNKSGGYRSKKYCSVCLKEVKAKIQGAATYIANLTKEQVMKKYAKYYIGRSAIRKHAQTTFDNSGKDKKCVVCGYDKHVDVAHIKSVSDFRGDSLISEINDENNLVGLCPNHHWEYDEGFIKLEDIVG